MSVSLKERLKQYQALKESAAVKPPAARQAELDTIAVLSPTKESLKKIQTETGTAAVVSSPPLDNAPTAQGTSLELFVCGRPSSSPSLLMFPYIY